MRKLFYFALIVVATTAFSCKKTSKKEQNSQGSSQTEETKSEDTVYDMHDAENSLDYFGIYKGVLPAGIDITVTLSKDNSFKVETINSKKNDTVHSEKGNFNLTESLLTLYYENGNIEYYRVGEGRIIKLDNDRNYIEGENADMYVLDQEEVF